MNQIDWASFLQGIMSPELSSLLFLVVGISMALTPWLAAGGQFIASRFELHDVRSLLPVESEVNCTTFRHEVMLKCCYNHLSSKIFCNISSCVYRIVRAKCSNSLHLESFRQMICKITLLYVVSDV